MSNNLITMIEKDHRTVEGMFQSYNSNQEPSVLTQLLDELALHATVEEEVVYPALRQQDVAVDEAQKDHGQVKELIAAIREELALTSEDGNLPAMVATLEGAVATHVDEEERDLLPHLADIEETEIEEMITRIEALKQG